MKAIRLYPKVAVKGQDFTKCKVVVIPSQSMTLRDIIQRFVRGEKLPLQKDGFYDENSGDLEKFVRQDLTDQFERSRSMWAALDKAAATIRERDSKPMAKSAGGGGAGEGPPSDAPASPPQVGTP